MAGGVTANQEETIAKLQAKPNEGKGAITAKQSEDLAALLEKKNTVKTLPKTCKTYLEGWVKEQIYKRRKEVTSKYLSKGNQCEDKAIRMLIDYYDLGYNEKNEQHFENDYMTGTPDLFYPSIVFDTKCSYDMSTFPLFETEINKDYWWQMQGYMELLNINNAGLVYVLVNTPDHIVDAEIRQKTFGMVNEIEIYNKAEEIRSYHNYDNVNMEYRIKRYDIKRDEQAMEAVKDRVMLCRRYINEITRRNK
jgi:hypothetical protein